MTDPVSASTIAQIYQYFPIPTKSRSIRVLRIDPWDSLKEDGGPLRGAFQLVDLFATPNQGYTALSYVWGEMKDAAPTSQILLGPDHVPLPLTDNCYNALNALRSTTQSLNIWVDAICINQESLAEKSHQLPLMGDIYSKADTTYIWLGLENDRTVRAIDCLHKIGMLEYFFGTPQQGPGAFIRPRPLAAAWELYWRRWEHIKHGLRWRFDVDGIKCTCDKQALWAKKITSDLLQVRLVGAEIAQHSRRPVGYRIPLSEFRILWNCWITAGCTVFGRIRS